MTKVEIMNGITRAVHKVGFKFKKHSPEILLGVGVVGVVSSAVMACKATTKVSEILEETKKDVGSVHECLENPKYEDYTEEVSKKDLSIIYAQTGLKLVKLYAPAVTIGVASIGCILASHNIIRNRNAALAAAYATVDKGFKDYRNRVIDRFGKDLDRELKYNIRTEEVETVVTDDKGEKKVVKQKVEVVDDPNQYSEYARFFDEYCLGWTDDPDANLLYVKQRQNYANEILKIKGHLFLNEVYDMFGFPRTKAGQVMGWVYDEKNPMGDNFVDFGVFNLYRSGARDFVNGREPSILLDFNVDGDVYSLLT